MASSSARGTPRLLAAIAVFYAAYLGAYFVLGGEAFHGPGSSWLDALVLVPATAALIRASRRSDPPLRGFLLGNAALLALLLLSDASFILDVTVWSDRRGEGVRLTDLAYLLFLLGWSWAWGSLALELGRRQRPGLPAVAVFLVLMVGFVGLFTGFYGPLYHQALGSLNGRIGMIMALLELLAVISGLAVLLAGVGHALVLQVFGLTLLVASDMLYSGAQVAPTGLASADPVWMLGQVLLLAGALMLPGRGVWLEAVLPAQQAGAGARRSGLSTLLLGLSLGAVLLSAMVSLALRILRSAGQEKPTPGEPFFFVLFVVALVVAMIWLTDRFDRAVHYAGRYARRLFEHRLSTADWRSGDRQLAWVLEATALGPLLDCLGESAGRLRQDILFLGPERLHPPPRQPSPGEPPTCFIVMPFSLPDSDGVHAVLRQVCRDCGLQPLRGDDLFRPSDILDDIWHGINGAFCVIADISGRNPNVLYELGIAHTLAKPVLILSRTAEDIPIDLATRRVILYGTTDQEDWRATLAERVRIALQGVMEDYRPVAGSAEPPQALFGPGG